MTSNHLWLALTALLLTSVGVVGVATLTFNEAIRQQEQAFKNAGCPAITTTSPEKDHGK